MKGRLPEAQRAYDLLVACGITAYPVPVEQVATSMGAQIVRSKAEGGQSGFSLRDGTSLLIGVNSGTSRRRQRFTIAHEIGHLQLHPGNLIVDSTLRVNYRDDVSSMATDLQEIEANRFAAALLMPEDWVRSAVPRLLQSATSREEVINGLAREFDVSAEAMGFRLINLGIASA